MRLYKNNIFQEYLDEMAKLPQWKHHQWFGDNGIFMKNGRLNIDTLQEFKLTVLSQLKNLNNTNVNEYKDFNQSDWLFMTLIGFQNGTYRDRKAKTNLVRLTAPTPSDSSIMRAMILPKVDTSSFRYEVDYDKKEAHKALTDRLKTENPAQALTVLLKSGADVVNITFEESTIQDNQKEWDKEGYRIIDNYMQNGYKFVTLSKTNKTKTLELIKSDRDGALQGFHDAMNSEIVQYEQAYDLIFADENTLTSNIEDINLPAHRYYVFKKHSEVKNDPTILWSEQPSTTEKGKTMDRYVRVFKDANGFTGSVFKFNEFGFFT